LKTLTLVQRFQWSRFFSGEDLGDEPALLNHRRIFILPSRRGLGFMVLLLLLLLIAFVYNNNLTYMLTFLLASVFFITILHSFKALAGLIVRPGQSPSVFAGEAAAFEIYLENPGDRPRFNLHLTLSDTAVMNLAANSKAGIRLTSKTTHRGWHHCGTVTLSSTFPLGLFRVWSPLRFNLKTLVYPKPSVQELPFPMSPDDASTQGATRQGVDDFYGLQEYQKGDSIKHIHWQAYAKGQGLISRRYSGEQGAALWLTYDATHAQSLEERLSQLCRWVLDAEKAGVHYGLVLPGFKASPGLGLAHRNKCLKALALF